MIQICNTMELITTDHCFRETTVNLKLWIAGNKKCEHIEHLIYVGYWISKLTHWWPAHIVNNHSANTHGYNLYQLIVQHLFMQDHAFRGMARCHYSQVFCRLRDHPYIPHNRVTISQLFVIFFAWSPGTGTGTGLGM